MAERLYLSIGINPKSSLDWRMYDLEGLTHFFHHGVVSLAKKLEINKDDYVLSPGEGTGAPSRLIVKLTGCRIVGIDINPEQVAKAKDLSLLHNCQDNIIYYLQDVEELNLRERNFSKAYCNETCGHWQNKLAAFSKIFTHLRPGAKIGFNAWLKGDKGSLNQAYQAIREFRPLYRENIWFQDDL